MTSNYPPDGLYPNGLQRQNFLPTIGLLQQWLDVVEVDGGIDYRLRALEQVETYHVPLGPDGRRRARSARSTRCARGPDDDPRLDDRGPHAARAAARRQRRLVRFRALCDGPRSQRDYLELAQRFAVVFLSDMPGMTAAQGDLARRFTWLVDILYDHRVKLVASAAAPPADALSRGAERAGVPAHREPADRDAARTTTWRCRTRPARGRHLTPRSPIRRAADHPPPSHPRRIRVQQIQGLPHVRGQQGRVEPLRRHGASTSSTPATS